MPKRTSKTGSELFIVDNSDDDWKVQRYLHDWCQLSKAIDVATGYFEIGGLLALNDEWQKVDAMRILMGDEVSRRTRAAFAQGVARVKALLDDSLETEKLKNDFLTGVPAIVEALRSGKIQSRVYKKDKFHAKTYITHARQEVVGSFALVGSSNLTMPGITENIELNVQIAGSPVSVLQEWFEEHWDNAEDVTAEILQVIERHTREYTPFEVYAKALQEYFRGHEVTDDEWEHEHSRMYSVLASYQRHGYHGLLKRAQTYGGALLCDGVGLGKTYIGLMLIERLVRREKKRVVLFVTKTARETVWEAKIRKYMPDLLGGFLSFRIYNHTDLLAKNIKLKLELEQMREQADVVIIDEGHHFRNTGLRAKQSEERRSRYWAMFDICHGKQVYLLTATPVNNRLTDFQHMVELFSQGKSDYFKNAPLGIHSFPGHIRRLEQMIDRAAHRQEIELGGLAEASDVSDADTDLAEAEKILRDDALFEELVVQRSRAFIKKSLSVEDSGVLFPEPSVPKVVPYSVKQTYGKLLRMVEEAFHKDKPLFSLAMYYPWDFYTGEKTALSEQNQAMIIGRQKQVVRLIRTGFLKRFESSVYAFQASCETLMKKLIAFYQVHAEDRHSKDRLDRWLGRNKEITGYDPNKPRTLFPDLTDLELADEDVVEPEFFEQAFEDRLDPNLFDIQGLLSDTLGDLDTLADFFKELATFEPKRDKKLQSLIQLLRGHLSGLKDVALQRQKVLIFSEFKATARYLRDELQKAGFDCIVEIDSDAPTALRTDVIKSFAPYYNDSSSAALAAEGLRETRLLISTDVLSEGLNLQDATRLVNYDLHWNPVRLMQRIGRIDRRLDPRVEQTIIRDHPDQDKLRGTIQYYNFLPPDELNELLTLYKTVTHKTLRISKTFGIENGKLLRPDDDYDILRDFTRQCEGTETRTENLHLEFQMLLKANPGLAERVRGFPLRVFSGKHHPTPGARGVFFCYSLPAIAARDRDDESQDAGKWTEEAGFTKWYLFDLASEKITDEPSEIIDLIRSQPETPRRCIIERKTLSEIRGQIDKHIKNTYLKQVQAPIGVKPLLKAWMELN
jgi:superfamily II DNA or RNA helicase